MRGGEASCNVHNADDRGAAQLPDPVRSAHPARRAVPVRSTAVDSSRTCADLPCCSVSQPAHVTRTRHVQFLNMATTVTLNNEDVER